MGIDHNLEIGNPEMNGATFLPQDVDTGIKLGSTYGSTEQEYAATALIESLSENNTWDTIDLHDIKTMNRIVVSGLLELEANGYIRINRVGDEISITPLLKFLDPIKEYVHKK